MISSSHRSDHLDRGPDPDPPPWSCEWWNDRLAGSRILGALRNERAPAGAGSLPWTLGSLVAVLLGAQALTGLLLMTYYRPHAPHASIAHMLQQVPFGWLVRSVHAWGAQLLVVVVTLHALVAVATRAYRRPRELTWVSGTALGLLAGALAVTGILLPGTAAAASASQVAFHLMVAIPGIGTELATVCFGDAGVSPDATYRLAGTHTAWLPAGAGIVAVVHLSMVRAHGLKPLELQGAPAVPIWPVFLRRVALVCVTTLTVLVCVSALDPPIHGPPADACAPSPAPEAVPWFLRPATELLRVLPPRVGPLQGAKVASVLLAIPPLVLGMLPWWARRFRAVRNPSSIAWSLGVGLALAATLGLVHTCLGPG